MGYYCSCQYISFCCNFLHTDTCDTSNMSVSFQFTITSYCKHNLLCIFFVSHYSTLAHFHTHAFSKPFLPLTPLWLFIQQTLVQLLFDVTEPHRAYTYVYLHGCIVYNANDETFYFEYAVHINRSLKSYSVNNERRRRRKKNT